MEAINTTTQVVKPISDAPLIKPSESPIAEPNIQATTNNQVNNYSSGYGASGYGGSGYGIGGYGMGGYGMNGYGMGMGGYGMGMGSYGMGGVGMMGRDSNDSLSKYFMLLERLNFHLFHLCEMVRMMQNQSEAIKFLFDMVKKAVIFGKDCILVHSVDIFNYLKHKIMSIFSTIKGIIVQYLFTNDLNPEELKAQLNVINYLIRGLVVLAVASVFLRLV